MEIDKQLSSSFFLLLYYLRKLIFLADLHSSIVAPGIKEMYVQKLIEVGLSICFDEFVQCIFEGKPICTENKNKILEKLSEESLPLKKDKVKLDNFLNKYKIYLQQSLKKVLELDSTEEGV